MKPILMVGLLLSGDGGWEEKHPVKTTRRKARYNRMRNSVDFIHLCSMSHRIISATIHYNNLFFRKKPRGAGPI